MAALYQNRREAGQRLARSLEDYAGRDDVLVLALSCGGAPVAVEVADVLSAPLDMLVIQQISVPQHEAWQMGRAMGVLASGGVRILNAEVVDAFKLPSEEIEQAVAVAHRELISKERAYRGLHPFPNVCGRIVILVDDGVETISPMRAAIEAMRTCGAARVIVATPVGSASVCQQLTQQADEVICLQQLNCTIIPLFYRDFPRITGEEVYALLNQCASMVRITSGGRTGSDSHLDGSEKRGKPPPGGILEAEMLGEDEWSSD
jgi:predicted phosphoribosyltransferase